VRSSFISYKSLKMQAYHVLKEAIISGTLTDHQMLTERTAMELFGISRTPFREAVQILEAEGWVYSLPYKGIYVSPVNLKDFEEVFELRLILETAIVRKVASRLDEKGFAVLERMVESMQTDSAAQNDYDFTSLDFAFHRTLNNMADNRRLLAMTEQIYDVMRRIGMRVLRRPIARREEIIREHRKILDGLRNGTAEAAVIEHLERVKQLMKHE
jgi:GntR family transcriptional regulator, rspAB operon transcriptional repressor